MFDVLKDVFSENLMLHFVCVVSTVVIFLLSRKISKNKFLKIVPPILWASLALVAVIEICDFSYESYAQGTKLILYTLSPATVAFAYPLYQFSNLIKFNAVEIFTATFASIFISIATTFFFVWFFNFDDEFSRSLLSKCVTTPVALEITKLTGGVMGLCMIGVFSQGILGAIFGHPMLSFFGIKSDISIGLAMGCTSHVIGTSKCMSVNERQAALSALVLVLVAIFTTLSLSLLTHFVVA